MAAPLVLVVPVVALVVWLVAALLVAPRRRRLARANEARYPGLAAHARRVQSVRLVALVAGVVVAVAVAGWGANGRGLGLVPAAFAVMQIVGVLVAERLGRTAARTAGVAGLESRVLGDYLPRGLTWAVLACGVATAGYLAWSTAVGDPDDRGIAGRSFEYGYPDPSVAGAFSPFPGSFYAVPIAIALGVLVLVAVIALLAVRARPRNGADPALVAADDILRWRAAESVVAGAGAGTAGTLAGVAGVVAGAMLPDVLRPNAPTGGAVMVPEYGLAPWVSLAGSLAALVLALWCVAVLLMPGASREPSGEEAAREPAGAR